MKNMELVFERTDLPILARYDVVVVGGSLAGIEAALALAQAGRSVLVVEARTYLGRELTATLRPWLPAEAAQATNGLAGTLVRSAGRAVASGEYALNMDAIKLHLEDVLLEAGVKLLYASLVVGVQADGGALQGVIVGNKSGRQFVPCHLLIDTTETALVAHLLDEIFDEAPAEAAFRRTLEFDGVALPSPLAATLEIDGQTLQLHGGYREKGHVLVEWKGTLPFPGDDAISQSRIETDARHQTMALTATLTNTMPAFESAYLSGASYELDGSKTPTLAQRPAPTWAKPFRTVKLNTGQPATQFAGNTAGVWYLNEAVMDGDLLATLATGRTLGHWLAEHPQASSTATVVSAPVVSTNGTRPQQTVRELASPQRGKPYQRTTVNNPALPVLREIDVLVVGGGTSGATAGITAASEGMRTVITEMNPGLGGTGTFGGVHSYWFGRRIGFSAKVMQYVDDMHVYLHHPRPKGLIPKWNIEAKSYALLKEADKAGAEILFNTFVIGTVVEGKQVCGIVVATRNGPAVILAKAIIDATGDGDVAAFAGAEYVYGHERDHITMWYALAQFTRPGLTRNHFTSMVDVSNTEDYTRAILAGRRRGNKNEMHDHGIYVAPRESRHIRGDVVLSLTDQIRQRRWEDVINIAFSNHDVKGHSGSDWLRVGMIPPNLEIEIPYRALLPLRLENILIVGKAISATHDALPAIRMQPDLENLGGIAALAAAQAVRENAPVRNVDLRRLQARLIEEDILPEDVLTRELAPRIYSDDELSAIVDAIPSDVMLYDYSDMELTDLHTGLIPFVEICCAGEQAVPILEAAVAQARGRRRAILAQALSLVGSHEAVPALIEAIMPHLAGDALPARTAHIRYTQLPPDHGAMPEVVYLLYSLGLVADERALPVWARVIELLAKTTTEDFHDDMKGVFYYVDAVCFGAERLGLTDVVATLRQLHQYEPFHGQARYTGFEADYVQERIAYLELVIGRTMARCASPDGYVVLMSYLNDSRALLAEHAHSELVAITGEDHGKDVQAWSRWLEFNGDDLQPKPWRPATDAVQSWQETMLMTQADREAVVVHSEVMSGIRQPAE
jgi:ribulose 1,5-bisphosphate synthetase/thiazole synthase